MKIQRILIAVDNSKEAEHAAEYGFGLAHLCKADVGLVNIVEPMVAPAPGPDMVTGSIFDQEVAADPEIMNIQKEVSENLIETTVKQFAGDLKVTQFSEFGSTANGILDCCAQFSADLIVIGTHSRSGLDRLLMGSVAEHVVRHSKVPVLVIPFVEKD
ncbi:MAG: universal stress protein [Bacteroidetes bacterium]|nr:universal stress protein [Bacteroidota bacterium]